MRSHITVTIERTTTASLEQITLPMSECILEKHCINGQTCFRMVQRYRYAGEATVTVLINHCITENEYHRVKNLIEHIG